MKEKHFPFEPHGIYYCIMCNKAIYVNMRENAVKIWAELESKYWTPELNPLCSPYCSLDFHERQNAK